MCRGMEDLEAGYCILPPPDCVADTWLIRRWALRPPLQPKPHLKRRQAGSLRMFRQLVGPWIPSFICETPTGFATMVLLPLEDSFEWSCLVFVHKR